MCSLGEEYIFYPWNDFRVATQDTDAEIFLAINDPLHKLNYTHHWLVVFTPCNELKKNLRCAGLMAMLTGLYKGELKWIYIGDFNHSAYLLDLLHFNCCDEKIRCNTTKPKSDEWLLEADWGGFLGWACQNLCRFDDLLYRSYKKKQNPCYW